MPVNHPDSWVVNDVHIVTQADVDGGAVSSASTSSGTDAAGIEVTDDASTTVAVPQNPSLSLIKTGTVDNSLTNPAGRTDAGDAIDYDFDVTNTGNVTLSSVSVDDPLAGTVSCPAGPLAPGAATTCTASLLIGQTDIDTGSVTNSATASATPPIGPDVNAVAGVTTRPRAGTRSAIEQVDDERDLWCRRRNHSIHDFRD